MKIFKMMFLQRTMLALIQTCFNLNSETMKVHKAVGLRSGIEFLFFLFLIVHANSGFAAIARPGVYAPSPALKGGLNQEQFAQCQQLLKQQCLKNNNKIPFPLYNNSCLTRLFKTPVCQQSYALYLKTNLVSNPPMRYGNINVFSVERSADGIDSTYMVDNAGRLIQLTGNVNLRSIRHSDNLLKSYPRAKPSAISLEDPTYVLLPNKTQQLIYLQPILLAGTNASRSNNWMLQMAYRFSSEGIYQGYTVVALINR